MGGTLGLIGDYIGSAASAVGTAAGSAASAVGTAAGSITAGEVSAAGAVLGAGAGAAFFRSRSPPRTASSRSSTVESGSARSRSPGSFERSSRRFETWRTRKRGHERRQAAQPGPA